MELQEEVVVEELQEEVVVEEGELLLMAMLVVVGEEVQPPLEQQF